MACQEGKSFVDGSPSGLQGFAGKPWLSLFSGSRLFLLRLREGVFCRLFPGTDRLIPTPGTEAPEMPERPPIASILPQVFPDPLAADAGLGRG